MVGFGLMVTGKALRLLLPSQTMVVNVSYLCHPYVAFLIRNAPYFSSAIARAVICSPCDFLILLKRDVQGLDLEHRAIFCYSCSEKINFQIYYPSLSFAHFLGILCSIT